MLERAIKKSAVSRSNDKLHPKILASFLAGFLLAFAVAFVPSAVNAQQTNLTDGDGFFWDIETNGDILNGTIDAFDNYGLLQVDGAQFPFGASRILELGGRQPAYGPVSLAGLNVTRRVYIPSAAGWARFLEYFENTTALPITVEVKWFGELGSDGQGPAPGDIVATFTGDIAFDTTDRWVITDDFSSVGGDPTLSHNFWGEFAFVTPSATLASSDKLDVRFNLTIHPFSTAILMVFIAQVSNQTAALAKADMLDSLTIDAGVQIEALFGVSVADQLRIANWTLSDDVDGDTVLNVDDNCLSIANLFQADLDDDGFGDVCDICPEIANPDQGETAACIVVTTADALCLEIDIELLLTDFLVEGDVTVEEFTTLPPISFTKPNGVGTSVFDNIDTNLQIARNSVDGVFNLGSDSTQWAAGTCAAPTSSFFSSHSVMLLNLFRPVYVNLPGSDTCLYDVTTETYYDVLWTSWSCCRQGGFAYTRPQAPALTPVVTAGYMDSMLPEEIVIAGPGRRKL